MKYSEWLDLQFGKAIIRATRANASGKMTNDAAAQEIAKANARTRHKLAWLKSHPEAETSFDERRAQEYDPDTG